MTVPSLHSPISINMHPAMNVAMARPVKPVHLYDIVDYDDERSRRTTYLHRGSTQGRYYEPSYYGCGKTCGRIHSTRYTERYGKRKGHYAHHYSATRSARNLSMEVISERGKHGRMKIRF